MSIQQKPSSLMVSSDAALLAEGRKTTLVREATPDCLTDAMLAPGTEAVIVDLDDPSGMELLSKLVRARVPRVIAVASKGIESWTLEYTLLNAELRGASATFPKPLDADDILGLVGQPLLAA